MAKCHTPSKLDRRSRIEIRATIWYPITLENIIEIVKEPIPISMKEVAESDMTTTGLCIIRYISSSETEDASLQLNPNRSEYSEDSEAKSPESDSVYSSESDVTSGDVLT